MYYKNITQMKKLTFFKRLVSYMLTNSFMWLVCAFVVNMAFSKIRFQKCQK